MRVRESSLPTVLNTSTHYKYYSGTPSNPWRVTIDRIDQHVAQSSLYSYMEDYVTPHFRKRIANGEIINNPMAKTAVVESLSGGSFSIKLITYSTSTPVYYTGWESVGTWYGSLYGKANQYKAPVSIDVTDLRDRAVVEAHSKNKANDTQLIATIGELKETVNSIRDITWRAVKICKAVRRANLKALAKEITPKELANRWMEARYALRPLVYDVSQTLDAFCNDAKTKRITARGFRTEWANASDEVLIHGSSDFDIYAARSVVQSVEARAGVLSYVDTLTKANIWGVDQVASSAWELVPLSFVVDWFVNVGKTIAAWEPTIGLKALASWVVTRDVTVQQTQVSRCVAKWPTVRIQERSISHTCSCTKTTSVTRRIVNPELPVFPRFDVKLDGYKLLDLGIILKNILK